MSKGFTISLAVIVSGIAFVLLYPVFNHKPGVAREKIEIRSLKMALNQFKAEYSFYPTGELDAVVSALSGGNPRKLIFLEWFRTPQDRGNRAVDPWGTPYRLQMTATNVVVKCAGPDKKFDTPDDRSTH